MKLDFFKWIDILMVIFVALAWASPAFAQTPTPTLRDAIAKANAAACHELSQDAPVLNPSDAVTAREQAYQTCMKDRANKHYLQTLERCNRSLMAASLPPEVLAKHRQDCMQASDYQ